MRIVGRVAGSSAGTSIANAFITSTAALTGLWLARILGPSDRGIYSGAFAWFSTGLYLGEFGIANAIVFFVAGAPQSARQILADARRLWLYFGLAIGVLGVSLAWLLSASDIRYGLTLAWLFVFMPIAFRGVVPICALQAVSVVRWNVSRAVQPAAFPLLLVAVQLATHQMTLYAAIICLTASIAVQWGTASWLLHPLTSATPTGRGRFTRPLLSYGRRAFMGAVPYALSSRLDILFLTVAATGAQLGQYSVAVTMASFSLPVAQAFGYLALPRLAREKDPAARRAEGWRAVRLSALAAAGMAVLIAVAANLGATRVLGAGYALAGPLTAVLCPGAAARAISSVTANVLRGMGRPGAVAGPEILGLVSLAIGLLILVPILGVAGAAWASTAAMLLMLSGYLVTLIVSHSHGHDHPAH